MHRRRTSSRLRRSLSGKKEEEEEERVDINRKLPKISIKNKTDKYPYVYKKDINTWHCTNLFYFLSKNTNCSRNQSIEHDAIGERDSGDSGGI